MAGPVYGSPLFVSGQGTGALVCKTRVTLDAAATSQETHVPHKGPSGATPSWVVCQPITNATAGGFVGPTEISYDTTDDEVDILFEGAGNVAGCVFDVFVFFIDVV